MSVLVAGAAVVGGIAAYHFFKTSNKKVTNIRELNKGDHIKFKRGLYSHHAIVVDVYPDKNQYKVIHFTGDKTSGLAAEITEEILPYEYSEITLIRYRYGRLDRSSSVKRAYHLLQLQQSTRVIYNILMNNCEHFVTWCITGEAESQQVNKALAFLTFFIGSAIKRPH